MISTDDYLHFVDDALDAMIAIVSELGDPLASERPDLPGANSPFAILTHCLGVMEFWGGQVVAGRTIVRDRDAEFTASGEAAVLVARAEEQRAKLRTDIAELDASAPPRGQVLDPDDAELPLGRTQGGALIHIYEELSQHLGQMEISRDVLAAGRAEDVIPVLRVSDAPAAAGWYGRLGFREQWRHQFEPGLPWFISIHRGPLQIYLSEHTGDARPDTLVHLDVREVDDVAAEFGVAVDEDGLAGREIALTDPDGNRLRIASPRR